MIISTFDRNVYDYEKFGWKVKKQITFDGFELERDSNSTIDCKFIVETIDIAWVGWGCDSRAWLIETSNNQYKLYTTNHGQLKEINIDYLKDKIHEYKDLIEQTKQVIDLMEISQ